MKVYDRYARAFFELSKTDKESLEILNMKKSLDKEVEAFFNNPIVDVEHKKEVVNSLATTKGLRTFLKFMLDKNRFDFRSFVNAFEKLSDKKNQLVRGKVITASELSSESKKNLEKTFFKKLNKKVIFEYETDKAILGGVKVEIDGTVFEDTLANKLNRLQNI